MSPPKLPDHNLAESDPIAYMEQRAKYDADMQQLPTATIPNATTTTATTAS